jgi:hypothetical protein
VFIDFAAFLSALKADKDKVTIKDAPTEEQIKTPESEKALEPSNLEKSGKVNKMLKERNSLDEE